MNGFRGVAIVSMLVAGGFPPCALIQPAVAEQTQVVAEALAAVPATVTHVAGGRAIGMIDPRTDGQRLWLRVDTDRSQVLRGIRWDDVRLVQWGDQQWDRDEAQRRAPELASARRAAWPPMLDSAERGAEPLDPSHLSTAASADRVRTIDVEAHLGRWQRGVAADGLYVWVRPITDRLMCREVCGTAEVDLIGARSIPSTRGPAFQNIGRWVVPLTAATWTGEGYLLQLPFRAVHPEWDLRLAPHGLIHVRLAIPGEGTFDATTAATRIRAYNPLRDWLQRHTGTRYLPEEFTSTPRQATGRRW